MCLLFSQNEASNVDESTSSKNTASSPNCEYNRRDTCPAKEKAEPMRNKQIDKLDENIHAILTDEILEKKTVEQIWARKLLEEKTVKEKQR